MSEIDERKLTELIAYTKVLKLKRRGKFVCEYDDKGIKEVDLLYELAYNEVRCVVCGRLLVSSAGVYDRSFYIVKCPCNAWAHYRCLGKVWKVQRKGFLSSTGFIACPKCGHKLWETDRPDSKRFDPWERHYRLKAKRIIRMSKGKFTEFLTAFRVSVKLGGDDLTVRQFRALREQVAKEIDLMKADIYKLHLKKAQLKAVKCSKCGASLPKLKQGQETFVCPYCSTPHVVSWE